MNKLSSLALFLIIFTLLVILPSVNANTLMNGTQSSKTFVFLWGIEAVFIVAVIRFWLGLGNEKNNWSAPDLLFFIFMLYMLSRNNWRELSHSLLFLELIGLAILYIIIRRQSTQNYLWILIGLSIGGLVQAIYGNLQLWGYFPSHHGQFKMTGSFFNPGPYAGYLAAIFPISLGLYLFKSLFNIKAYSFESILNSYIHFIKSYFVRLYRTHFFYNNNEEKSSQEKHKSRIRSTDYTTMKSIFLISIISICLVLPASRSRAAWLAVTVSSLYLLSIRFNLTQQIKDYFNTRIRRYGVLLFLVLTLTLIGSALYHFKKGSTDGRLLIWKVSTEMIEDRPLLGYGYDSFKKHYMDYQAKYFNDNPDSRQAMVAGDTNYAFNELIQITVENGILGLSLFVIIILYVFFEKYWIFKYRRHPEVDILQEPREIINSGKTQNEKDKQEWALLHISRAVVISVLVFALFSYPSQILPIKICLIAAIAIIATFGGRITNIIIPKCIHLNKLWLISIKSIVSIACLGFLIIASSQIRLHEKAHSDWKNAFDLYNIGLYEDCLTYYEKAYKVLKTNGDFLTNYGKALSMAEKHEKAINVLQQAAIYYPNTVVYTALGDSYKKLGQTVNAEQAYIHAWYMNPSRFYPKYLLAKLYDESGQKDRAIEVAKELLSKDIKIESKAIQEIQEEMKRIIEKNNSEIQDEVKI